MTDVTNQNKNKNRQRIDNVFTKIRSLSSEKRNEFAFFALGVLTAYPEEISDSAIKVLEERIKSFGNEVRL